MQRIFITHIVPKDKILEYHLSIAACNFSYNLIEGKLFDKVYSILPTFVRRKITLFDGLIRSKLRNIPGIYKLAPLWENVVLFHRIPRKASVWYYNCTLLNATVIVLLKLFKPGVKQNMIILDYTPGNKLSDKFFLWLTNHMDGTIRLANAQLFTCKNSVCLPGVVPLNTPSYPEIATVTKRFLISGMLNDNIAMLPLLLEVFACMPEMELHITGKAPDKSLVNQYTGKYKNIVYHGMLPYDEYLSLLHEIPFLLSTRNPDAPENQCNFPSKIIEALLHNRIIVSTLHYEQLEGIRYFEVPVKKEHLINALNEIAHLPEHELLTYANQSATVRKRFGADVWKTNMEQIENNVKK